MGPSVVRLGKSSSEHSCMVQALIRQTMIIRPAVSPGLLGRMLDLMMMTMMAPYFHEYYSACICAQSPTSLTLLPITRIDSG